MQELEITYVPLDSLVAYEGNAKLHPDEQVDQIAESMERFGFNDPLAVWKDDVVIEGHGRLLAARKLAEEGKEEFKTVPIIRLDNLTDEQRKAYALVHNKLTMNSGFDFEKLQEQLEELSNTDIDMSDFGFDMNDAPDIDGMFAETEPKNPDDKENETKMIKCPLCGEMFEIDPDGNVVR